MTESCCQGFNVLRVALLIFLCFLIAVPGGQAASRSAESDCPMAAMMASQMDTAASDEQRSCCSDIAAADMRCNMEMPCGSPSFLSAPVVALLTSTGPEKPLIERIPLIPPIADLAAIWRPPNLI